MYCRVISLSSRPCARIPSPSSSVRRHWVQTMPWNAAGPQADDNAVVRECAALLLNELRLTRRRMMRAMASRSATNESGEDEDVGEEEMLRRRSASLGFVMWRQAGCKQTALAAGNVRGGTSSCPVSDEAPPEEGRSRGASPGKCSRCVREATTSMPCSESPPSAHSVRHRHSFDTTRHHGPLNGMRRRCKSASHRA